MMEKVKMIFLKYWKWISIGLFLILLLIFRENILQLLLLIFLLGCVGYVLYKTVHYIFKYGFLGLKWSLKVIAFVIAVATVMTLLSRL